MHHNVSLCVTECFVPNILTPLPLQVLRTPLHSASEAGATHCVNTLIKYRANVEAADCEGNTPMHLALASDDSNDGVIAALKAAGCDMAAKNVHGLTCAEVEDVRRELAAEKVAKAERAKDDARGLKDKKKDEKLSELRDFLETDAELDAPSIEALLVAGRLGSMNALVKLCDCDDRLRKVIKEPKAAKRLQAAVRAFVAFVVIVACECRRSSFALRPSGASLHQGLRQQRRRLDSASGADQEQRHGTVHSVRRVTCTGCSVGAHDSFGQVLRVDGHAAVQVIVRSVCVCMISFSTFPCIFLMVVGGAWVGMVIGIRPRHSPAAASFKAAGSASFSSACRSDSALHAGFAFPIKQQTAWQYT